MKNDQILKFWRGLILSEMPIFCFKNRGVPSSSSVSRLLESPTTLPSISKMAMAARREQRIKDLWSHNYASAVRYGGNSKATVMSMLIFSVSIFVNQNFQFRCKSGSLVHLLCFSDGG